MKRLIAAVIMPAMLIALASCGNKPEQTLTESLAETDATVATSATEASVIPSATEETVFTEPLKWEGKWQATDTEEYFEITDVTDTGFSMVFYHYEEGTIEQFKYKIEFDDPSKTVASEIGKTNDHGVWEYVFHYQGDTILVQSKHPDQIYERVV